MSEFSGYCFLAAAIVEALGILGLLVRCWRLTAEERLSRSAMISETARADSNAEKCQQEREAAAAATRRADNQFHCIADTIDERDGIWKMYREHVLGAGAAQDLLWSELERMGRFIAVQAHAHGFALPEPSKELQQVLGNYRSRHRDEAAAKAGVLEAKAKIQDDIRDIGKDPTSSEGSS